MPRVLDWQRIQLITTCRSLPIILGAGERKQQAHKETSVIAETFEAVISAIYQDTGFETVKALVAKWFGEFI